MKIEDILASYRAYRAEHTKRDYYAFIFEDDLGNKYTSYLPLYQEDYDELVALKQLDKDEFNDELLSADNPTLKSILCDQISSFDTDDLTIYDYDLMPKHLYEFKLAIFFEEDKPLFRTVSVHISDDDYEKMIVWRHNQLGCRINFESLLFSHPDIYKGLVEQFQNHIVAGVPHIYQHPYAVFLDELEEDFNAMPKWKFQIGDLIPFNFCGPDGYSTDHGKVIFRNEEHILIQFNYISIAADYLNRTGMPYEAVLSIIGHDIPHNETDRFVDMLDSYTLEVIPIE